MGSSVDREASLIIRFVFPYLFMLYSLCVFPRCPLLRTYPDVTSPSSASAGCGSRWASCSRSQSCLTPASPTTSPTEHCTRTLSHRRKLRPRHAKPTSTPSSHLCHRYDTYPELKVKASGTLNIGVYRVLVKATYHGSAPPPPPSSFDHRLSKSKVRCFEVPALHFLRHTRI